MGESLHAGEPPGTLFPPRNGAATSAVPRAIAPPLVPDHRSDESGLGSVTETLMNFNGVFSAQTFRQDVEIVHFMWSRYGWAAGIEKTSLGSGCTVLFWRARCHPASQ
jgi:hypothetical protein